MLGWTRYVPDARRRRRGDRGKIALEHMKEFPTTTSASSGWRPKPSATGQRRSP